MIFIDIRQRKKCIVTRVLILWRVKLVIALMVSDSLGPEKTTLILGQGIRMEIVQYTYKQIHYISHRLTELILQIN